MHKKRGSFNLSLSLTESERTSCPIPVRCRPSVPSERSGQALRVSSLLARVCFGFSHRVEWMSWASGLHPVHYRDNNKKIKKTSSRCKLCLQAAEWTTEMGGSGPLSGLGTLNPTGMKWIPVHIWLAQAWDKLSHWVTRIGRVFRKAWGCSDGNEDEVVKQRNKSEQHFRGYWNFFNLISLQSHLLMITEYFPVLGEKH